MLSIKQIKRNRPDDKSISKNRAPISKAPLFFNHCLFLLPRAIVHVQEKNWSALETNFLAL